MPETPIAMLTLLSPAWLMGLAAAVGLPVAAHLLSRVRYFQVAFPATRFVEQAVVQTTQVNRPRHLLLLLLRILALACVVLAFTRPQWHAAAATPSAADGESLVIILDASASMQRTQRGAALFDQARRRALTTLDTLDPARDTVSVILADRSPRMLLPEPTANTALLRDRLAQTRCSYASADLAAAVTLAYAVLQTQDKTGRILIISDGQLGNRSAQALTNHAPGITITEARVGASPADNHEIRLVEMTPYPPVLASPLAITVELNHFGKTAQPITLQAEGAGGNASRAMTLQPGAATTQTITLTPTTPGIQAIRVWVEPDDAFDLDEMDGRVVEIATARDVHLFTNTLAGTDTTASRIERALAPSRGAEHTFEVTTAQPRALVRDNEPVEPSGACWVLTGIEQFDGAWDAAMQRHLESGGGVVWVADTPAARRAAHGLAFSPLRFAGDTSRDAVVAAVRFDHPALAVFEGPARASLVGQRLSGVAEAQVAEGSEVLMRSADGRPILALRRVGRGRLFVVNADLTPGQTDFASQPAFVAWVNELVTYAAPGPALPPPRHPGDPLPQAVLNPHTLQSPTQHSEARDPGRIWAPGLYLGLDADGTIAAGLYASLDPAESDFTQAPVIDTTRTATPGQVGTANTTAAGNRNPIELWPMCIVAAMLLVGFESLALLAYARREGGA